MCPVGVASLVLMMAGWLRDRCYSTLNKPTENALERSTYELLIATTLTFLQHYLGVPAEGSYRPSLLMSP